MAGEGARSFYEGLVESGLIIPSAIAGAFGRSGLFEDVLARTDAFLAKSWAGDGAEWRNYPPILEKDLIERTDYMESFPQLLGAISSFSGKELKAREIVDRIKEKKAWDDLLGPTDVVLAPAACYPVYPTLTGKNPEGGKLICLMGWAFRREPSPEPTRMQAFRVRELIKTGSAEDCVAWRDTWLERSMGLLKQLELPIQSDVATDPFFGRAGRMMAVQQVEQKLKFEVAIPVMDGEPPTAVCSFNYHQDHFSRPYNILDHEGNLAHTACLGFGMERLIMAMFKTHGFDPKAWPASVREKLWP